MRWACSKTCWVLTPSESVTPGLGVVVDIIWKMIQKCAGAISRWTTCWATSGGMEQSSLGSSYPPPPWPCGAAPGTRCPISGSPTPEGQKDAGKLKRVFLEDCQNVFCDLQQMFWDLWGEAEEAGRVFLSSREKPKVQFNSSLQLPEGQFQRW